MMENYVNILRHRMHRVLEGWHLFTAKEKVRKQPALFMLKRSELMRKFRMIRRCFRKWTVRFGSRQTTRFIEEGKDIDSYTKNWQNAGDEMRESMILIGELNEKLGSELSQRRKDLKESVDMAEFMKHEQKSLAFALANLKFEIEKVHGMIGKSSLRYFVDLKSVHGNVVEDVPYALTRYLEQVEQQRIQAQKAAALLQMMPPKQKVSPVPALVVRVLAGRSSLLHIRGAPVERELVVL
jgi:hypothetical protein